MLLLLLTACTTMTMVAPGAAPGEVYVTASTLPFRRGYVLRCTATPAAPGELRTTCVRILDSDRVTELRPYDGDVSASWVDEVAGPTEAATSAPPASWLIIGAGESEVSVDGVATRGGAATRQAVSAGTHQVRAVLPDGTVLTESVTVAPGEIVTLRVEYASGQIVVSR